MPMFGESDKESRDGSPTIIARGVRVEGDFVSPGDVIVEGDVQGKVEAKGTLKVGSSSHIRADVHAGEAMIAGTIEGNIRVEKRLDLKATANIKGDVQAQVMSIEAGARLEGHASIGAKANVAEEATANGRPKVMRGFAVSGAVEK